MLGHLRILVTRFDGAVARNALAFSVFVGATKSTAVDLSVQAATSDEIDWRRAGVFGSFGAVWMGGGQFIVLNRLLPWMFPGLLQGQLRAAFKGMVFDQAVHMPFMYLPIFYCIRELGESRQSVPSAIEKGMTHWCNNVYSDSTLQLGLFVPFQLFNFTLVPPHFRVPSLVTFGMIWTGILSYRRGKHTDDAQAGAIE